MKVTEHPLYQQRREKLDLLEKRIWDVRGQMYVDKIYFGGHDSMTLKDSYLKFVLFFYTGKIIENKIYTEIHSKLQCITVYYCVLLCITQ